MRCLGKWSSSSFMLIKQQRDAFRGGTWSCSVSSLLLLSLSQSPSSTVILRCFRLLQNALRCRCYCWCCFFCCCYCIRIMAKELFLHALFVCVCCCLFLFGNFWQLSPSQPPRRLFCLSLYLSLCPLNFAAFFCSATHCCCCCCCFWSY